MTNLLNTGDFYDIRHAGTETMTFDHVRMPVDPSAFGVNPTTGEVGSNTTVVTSNGTTVADNFAALKTLISRATGQGLAVIIDFHPFFLGQKHYDYMVGWPSSHSGSATGTGYNLYNGTNASSLYSTYDSIWKYDLITVGNGLNANHPLAKFWHTFLGHFSEAEAPHDKVYWEILNEPMVDFSMSKINPNNYNPSNEEGRSAWRTWMGGLISAWRSVQLNALKIALTDKPTSKFIVTTALADCRELGSITPYQHNNSNWPNVPVFGNPYTPVDIGSWDDATRVIYTTHIYTPIHYTHWDSSLPDGEYYQKNPDYLGINPPEPYWDSMETPAFTSVLAWQYATQSLFTFESETGVQSFTPPVMFTEAGVKRRDGSSDPGVIPSWPTESNPDYNFVSYMHDRLIWHYDMRRLVDDHSMGYDIYELVGAFGVNNGTSIHTYVDNNHPIHGHGSLGSLHPQMKDALFVWTARPRSN